MKECFDDFIAKRCEEALLSSKEYAQLLEQLEKANKDNDMVEYENISADIHLLMGKICYMACAKDIFSFVLSL